MNRLIRVIVSLAASFVVVSLASGTSAGQAPQTNAATSAISAKMADVDGLKIHYMVAGHGSALILLHGYAETSRMWRPIIPQLAGKFMVIAPPRMSIRIPGPPV